MPYQHPAPRYSKPMPVSRLPAPWGEGYRPRPRRSIVARAAVAIVAALRDALEREREDYMLRIGIGLGLLGSIVFILALASI